MCQIFIYGNRRIILLLFLLQLSEYSRSNIALKLLVQSKWGADSSKWA